MTQVVETKTRPVGAHVPENLYLKYKSIIVGKGLTVQEVTTKMIELFVNDEEFRDRVLGELKGGGN